ncbi:arginase family protein [Streptomyces sp. NPDC101150]|uniref:arginase family protein n=1 Tax=Streptomyces sp. NPDC101150 TaxID=3366114 RepID=UPI003829B951
MVAADTLLARGSATFSGICSAAISGIPSGAAAAVIGAGTSLGAPHRGAENGPHFLRTLSKHYTWSAQEPSIWEIDRGRIPLERAVDVGDVVTADGTLDGVLAALRSTVLALPPAVRPCVIGGDHSITLPVVQALQQRRQAPFTVVQFDHHLDLQIWEGRMGAERDAIFHTNVMSHVSDVVGPGRLVQIGIAPHATLEASNAPAMVHYLRSVGRQISLLAPELGDASAFQQALGRDGDVYLTVDVDVLDSSAMSTTGYPAPIGLSVRELLRNIDLTLQHNRLIGFDVVEFGAPKECREAKALADGGRAALVFQHLLSWACRQA